jgi:hypothetical protein
MVNVIGDLSDCSAEPQGLCMVNSLVLASYPMTSKTCSWRRSPWYPFWQTREAEPHFLARVQRHAYSRRLSNQLVSIVGDAILIGDSQGGHCSRPAADAFIHSQDWSLLDVNGIWFGIELTDGFSINSAHNGCPLASLANWRSDSLFHG